MLYVIHKFNNTNTVKQTLITGIQNECIEGHSAIPTFSNPCKKDVVIADARAISVKFDKPGKRCRHIATGSIICMPIALLTDPYCRLLGARILQLGTPSRMTIDPYIQCD